MGQQPNVAVDFFSLPFNTEGMDYGLAITSSRAPVRQPYLLSR